MGYWDNLIFIFYLHYLFAHCKEVDQRDGVRQECLQCKKCGPGPWKLLVQVEEGRQGESGWENREGLQGGTDWVSRKREL